ncbi:ATP-binding protein [Flavobacterium sp. UBA4197]|uniref:ATP-binding protein n=1 Tax=Flavobacterium sp. UBA4197 TaxID=1946546 RepID=UPI00257DE22C|nr:ATP-binding protein [Flavobacterium sp. UBA4197]
MNNISPFIVRITNPIGSGGGFIICPEENDGFAYVITARHCLVDRKNDVPWKKEEICIGFLSHANITEYQVINTDKIAFGSNNLTEDIGVLIIPKSALPDSVDIKFALKTSAFPGRGAKIEITGFPRAVDYEFKRSLYQLTVMGDKDYENQIQIEVSDPVIGHYNSDILVEGYSGSPILVVAGGTEYVTGVFLAYEQTTRRIKGIDLKLINRLLDELGEKSIDLKQIETNESIFKDLERLESNSERVFSRIRMRIGELELERSDLTEKVIAEITKVGLTLISGKPGSGKSAIIKKALSKFDTDHQIIAIQGEQLDRKSIDEIFSAQPFSLVNGLENVLFSPACAKNKIVVIDSIEKLLETGNADTILDFFELVSKNNDIKLVLTCRNYAVEQLKIRFLRDFPAFLPFEIPLLCKDELHVVADKYPVVKSLLQNKSIAKILEIPFNLDKATILTKIKLGLEITSEAKFRELMWEYVVEGKEKEPDANIRKQRGEAFSNIAIQRASSMSPYTTIAGLSPEIAEALVADNIIDPEPVFRKSYAAAHDIYEDWAITRYIEIGYQIHLSCNDNQAVFFEKLGSGAAIRRAFRLWVSDLIQSGSENVGELLTATLDDTDVPNHWKDEVIIAAMQSSYSMQFLSENKELLFLDKFKFFKRVVFLLKVACQEPDFSFIDQIEPAKRLKLYHNVNLKPYGEGWRNLIEFIVINLDALNSQMHLVFMMLMNWEKGLNDFEPLPSEARSAGLILLRYYDLYVRDNKFREKRKTYGVNTYDGIHLLFRLTEIIEDELKTLIETAFQCHKRDDDYRVIGLYGKIVDIVLDGHESVRICQYFPELVMQIAEKKWFYYAPTKEEIEEMMREAPFRSLPGSGMHEESQFGLKESTGMTYFPASPKQTPILNLLYAKPYKTLDFIIKMLNHVANTYVESSYGINNDFIPVKEERSVIQLTMPDGKVYEQYASPILWTAYRGTTVAIPNLLQSVLMALESFLLSLGKDVSEVEENSYRGVLKQVWDDFFVKLLTKSNNVMTTAVLLSVTYAYRNLAGIHMLPVLRIKKIYDWDLLRSVNERKALSPSSVGKDSFRRQKELHKFNFLDHRNGNIGELVINLSLGKLHQEIFEILDQFNAENPTEEKWRFMLAKMDRRKYKVVKEVENGFLVEPELAEDLREKVIAEQKVQEEANRILQASMWSIKKQKNETVENDNYDQWSLYFPSVQTGELNDAIHKYHKNTGAFAAIGVRDFFTEMNEKEREWCRKKIGHIVNYQLFTRQRYDMEINFSSFEIEGAFYSLPVLLLHAAEEERTELRKYVFYSLLFLEDQFSRNMLIQSINEKLWKAEPEFVTCCIEAMVKYCEISHLRHILNMRSLVKEPDENVSNFQKLKRVFLKNWNWSRRKNISGNQSNEHWYSEKEKLFDKGYQEILSTISKGIPIGMEPVNFDEGGTWHLFEALRIIPDNTSIIELRNFYSRLLDFILQYINTKRESYNDKLHYKLQQLFHEKFSLFLLKQPETISKEFMDQLTGWAFNPEFNRQNRHKCYEFVEKCLDEVIRRVIEDEEYTVSFWILWEHLAYRSLSNEILYFNKKLLLNDVSFNSSVRDWKPLEGKRDFFRPLVKGKGDLTSAVKLISGIGFKELMPEAIEWLAGRIEEYYGEDKNQLFYFESIIIRGHYDSKLRKAISNNQKSRVQFIKILDALIDRGASSSAYIIREDFVSNKG